MAEAKPPGTVVTERRDDLLSSPLNMTTPAAPGHIRTVKVAVIGSGLAGLTAAYSLVNQNGKARTGNQEPVTFEVHLFEKADQLGMDAASVSINHGGEAKFRTDVPMRSFQGGYYPNLISLYKHLGVKFRQADFTYTFTTIDWSNASAPLNPWLLYNGQNGIRGISVPASILESSNDRIKSIFAYYISLLFLVFSYIRLLFLSIPIYPIRPRPLERFDEWTHWTTPNSKIAKWMKLDHAWVRFVDDVLVPTFCAVCTATVDDVWAHPAREILDYIWKGLFTPHYVVTGGVQNVVKQLSKPLAPSSIHLSSHITSITPDEADSSKVSVHFRSRGDGALSVAAIHGFSHVIFATQANQAIPILSTYVTSPSIHPKQKSALRKLVGCLERFKYRKNIVITHTDDTLLPPNPSDRRDLSFVPSKNFSSLASKRRVPPNCVSPDYTMATHIISPPLSLDSSIPPVYQTTNPVIPPNPLKVISVTHMERAVLTVDSKRAVPLLSLQDASSMPFSLGKLLDCLQYSEDITTLQGGARLKKSQSVRSKYDMTQPGIWVCGSYCYEGIPLLEGCVVSAKAVVERGIMRSEGVLGDSRLQEW